MLLTDEEIKRVADTAHDNEPYIGVNVAIAKAQLKKVVEYFKVYDEPYIYIPELIALLDEVKDV